MGYLAVEYFFHQKGHTGDVFSQMLEQFGPPSGQQRLIHGRHILLDMCKEVEVVAQHFHWDHRRLNIRCIADILEQFGHKILHCILEF